VNIAGVKILVQLFLHKRHCKDEHATVMWKRYRKHGTYESYIIILLLKVLTKNLLIVQTIFASGK
jgi:hypothetical protein